MTRREFLRDSAFGLGAIVTSRLIPLPLSAKPAKPFKMAVITDLHHGLAPDALSRLQAFTDAVKKRHDLDLVMQMGDFNYSLPDSAPAIKLFADLPQPKIHVLGNHDMDKCDKDFALKSWGAKSRYGAYEFEHFKFVVLDLNHFKKEGKLYSYSNGNYFTDNATHNWADPEQLDWLATELRKGSKPVILISHQPLGFAEPNQPMPPEQVEVLDIVEKASKENPKGAVAVSMFGHLHVDRLEHSHGIPCYCQNSASYFWGGGMYAYSKPLFTFIEITTGGHLVVHGASGEFLKAPPKETDAVIGRSASVIDRRI